MFRECSKIVEKCPKFCHIEPLQNHYRTNYAGFPCCVLRKTMVKSHKSQYLQGFQGRMNKRNMILHQHSSQKRGMITMGKTMTRTQYKNNHIKEHYDRINLCIPKGQKAKIRAVTDKMGISLGQEKGRCKRQVLSSKKWQLISSIFWQLRTSTSYRRIDYFVRIFKF